LFGLSVKKTRSVEKRGRKKEHEMFYNNSDIKNISPNQLNEKMESKEDIFLLDVRTPGEHAAQAIKGSHLIPLQVLGDRMHELPKDKEIIVYCRVGNRSAYASAFLVRQGFIVKNLEGGIVLWNMAGNAAETRVS
jgi:phage shock protein E